MGQTMTRPGEEVAHGYVLPLRHPVGVAFNFMQAAWLFMNHHGLQTVACISVPHAEYVSNAQQAKLFFENCGK